MTESEQALEKAEKLPCWKGSVKPESLSGGITNTNFVVSDRGERPLFGSVKTFLFTA